MKVKASSDLFELSKKPEELAAYIEWLAVPADRRDPPSQAKMALKLGVTEQTLRTWKRDNRVVAKVIKKHVGNVGVDLYPDVLDTLRLQATDPSNPRSVTAAKLLLSELATQVVDVDEAIDTNEMTDEDLRDLALEVFDRYDERLDASPVAAADLPQ